MKQPMLTPISAGYYLQQSYSYQWIDHDQRYKIVVPRGFICDGASVPRIFWTLTGITPDGLHRPAALIHDFMYRYQGKLPSGSMMVWDNQTNNWRPVHQASWTRKQADQLFARILREVGVSKLKRRVMYLGVRAGGWASW